ncbi:hypothetical protein F2P56_000759 [Juglans regia]|uniref:Uncharacterized protein n=2 Tax=Juglans regia TaxID=51240 RepID=A0A834D3E3_JUGRE|nr:hypothetical protein F2P56_000759 [Juglans regia]
MMSPTHCSSPQKLLMLLPFLFMSFSLAMSITLPQKLDQTSVPQEANAEIKCGTCPCVNPCAQQQMPLPPPPPPPAPPKNPSTQYCTPLAPPLPPPPPRFIYVTGVPGNLYETDPYNTWVYYSGAGQNVIGIMRLLLLVVCGVVELIVIGWQM